MSSKQQEANSKSKEMPMEKELTMLAKAVETVAMPIFNALTVILPLFIQYTIMTYDYFQKLPQNMIHFLYGFVFCFFGGTFPTLFAAIQAAEHGGRMAVLKALQDLANEAMIIIEESKKDDEQDENKDGIVDVKQMTGSAYLSRKTRLVLRKMNPEKVDQAMQSLYRVWLSVAAVLSIQFARTISMALAISDFLKMPCDRFIAPTLQLVIPNDYDKWVPVILGWTCKSIAMSIAWYIQAVLSAAASALKGGLLMAQAFYQFCVYRDITLFGLISPDTAKGMIEVLSYVFAAGGFYFQYSLGFELPFPMNFLLWPFELAEYYIRWSITERTGGAP